MRVSRAVIAVVAEENANCMRVIHGLRTVAAAERWLMELISYDQVMAGDVGALRHNAGVVVFGDLDALRPRLPWPIVAVENDDPSPPHHVVKCDDAAVGAAAADHLLDCGLRSVAVFGVRGHGFSDARTRGFTRRVQELRPDVVPNTDGTRFASTPAEPDPRWHMSPPAIAGWVARLPKPVGIFATCDNWALLLSTACRSAGVAIPEDVAIVGVDNNVMRCEFAIPQLSSVAIPWERFGVLAAEHVKALLAGRGPQPAGVTRVPPSGVITRQSSDVLAVEDPDVAVALRLIRQHAHADLQVGDLVRMAAVDRHRLQAKFRQTLGRTILDEIHRVRIERAKQLLAYGDLSTSVVATRCGYTDASKLAHAFKAALGITPTAYRKRCRP